MDGKEKGTKTNAMKITRKMERDKNRERNKIKGNEMKGNRTYAVKRSNKHGKGDEQGKEHGTERKKEDEKGNRGNEKERTRTQRGEEQKGTEKDKQPTVKNKLNMSRAALHAASTPQQSRNNE